MSQRAQTRERVVDPAAIAVSYTPKNEILSKLPEAERAAIMNLAEEIHCPSREDMFDAGDVIERVYFPETGMISLVVVTKEGQHATQFILRPPALAVCCWKAPGLSAAINCPSLKSFSAKCSAFAAPP